MAVDSRHALVDVQFVLHPLYLTQAMQPIQLLFPHLPRPLLFCSLFNLPAPDIQQFLKPLLLLLYFLIGEFVLLFQEDHPILQGLGLSIDMLSLAALILQLVPQPDEVSINDNAVDGGKL